jgi:hypothetical protein
MQVVGLPVGIAQLTTTDKEGLAINDEMGGTARELEPWGRGLGEGHRYQEGSEHAASKPFH